MFNEKKSNSIQEFLKSLDSEFSESLVKESIIYNLFSSRLKQHPVKKAIEEANHTIKPGEITSEGLITLTKLLLALKDLNNPGLCEKTKKAILALNYSDEKWEDAILKSGSLEVKKELKSLKSLKAESAVISTIYSIKKEKYDVISINTKLYFDAVIKELNVDLKDIEIKKKQLEQQFTAIRQPVTELEDQILRQKNQAEKLYYKMQKAEKQTGTQKIKWEENCGDLGYTCRCKSSSAHYKSRIDPVYGPDCEARKEAGLLWVDALIGLFNLQKTLDLISSPTRERGEKLKSCISKQIQQIKSHINQINTQAKDAKKQDGIKEEAWEEESCLDRGYKCYPHCKHSGIKNIPIYKEDRDTRDLMYEISSKLQDKLKFFQEKLQSFVIDDNVLEELSNLKETNTIAFAFDQSAMKEKNNEIIELIQQNKNLNEALKTLDKITLDLFGQENNNAIEIVALEDAVRLTYDLTLYQQLAEVVYLSDSEKIHDYMLKAIVGLQPDSGFGVEIFSHKLYEFDQKQGTAFLWGLLLAHNEQDESFIKVYYLLVLLATAQKKPPEYDELKKQAYRSALHAEPSFSEINKEDMQRLDGIFSESRKNTDIQDKVIDSIKKLHAQPQSKPLKENLVLFYAHIGEIGKSQQTNESPESSMNQGINDSQAWDREFMF